MTGEPQPLTDQVPRRDDEHMTVEQRQRFIAAAARGLAWRREQAGQEDTRHLYAESSGPSSRWCLRCGAVVEDCGQHDRWHEQFDGQT